MKLKKLIPALGLLAFIGCNFYGQQAHENELMKAESGSLLSSPMGEGSELTIQVDEAFIMDIDVEVQEEKRYFLVGGNLQDYECAKELHDKLGKTGYPSQILNSLNEASRVAVNSYKNKELAIRKLHKLQAENKEMVFWILKM